MCGIGGKVSFDRRPDGDLPEKMVSHMAHRGPDASGVYADGPAILAHTRLSIFDLTDAGRQPMSIRDDTIHIVFNGEIYNYRELRERLPVQRLESSTDTEVLLHLYDQYGTDCLQYLRGMFAFGIWDERRERLFLARDRLGQKPLFYRAEENSLSFSSTIRAILADDEVNPAADIEAIRQYLTYHYVPAPRTGFDTIRQLRPAEYAVFDDDGFHRDTYWSLTYADQSEAPLKTLKEGLRDRFREATRLRLRSDVPVGVFLSGGIDSTIVTALASEIAEEPIDTYTVGFEGSDGDERRFGRLVADAYGTNHHEEAVSLDVREQLPTIVEHCEMPFGDPSAVPTYYVSQVAARDKKVVIGGDGGDELFAGYSRYSRDMLLSQFARIPDPILGAAHRFLTRVRDPVPGTKPYYLARALEIAAEDELHRHAELVSYANGERLDTVLSTPASDDQFEYLSSIYREVDGPALLDRMTHLDLRTYLPNAILAKVDRMTMAHSLEARSPFLDHAVAEYAASIPMRYKWRRGSKKRILKQSFAPEIPQEILNRGKSGFGAPVGPWLRNELADVLATKLARLGDRPPFDASGIAAQLDEHRAGEKYHANRLWNLLMLELWYERFIEGTQLVDL